MNDRHKGENLKIEVEYISEDSNNSIDDFKATQKLISLVPEASSPENYKSKNKKNTLLKKNTRISSNNDEDIEYLDNENNCENLNIQITDNIKTSTNNFFTDSDNNLYLSHSKRKSLEKNSLNLNNSLNKYDKLNNSENANITKKDKYMNEESDFHSKQSNFSPIRKRRRIIIEEKRKNKGIKRNIYALENKEDKKDKKEEEEKKVYRKDKNGTEICKKNKKKVKIGFLEPFVNVTLIESFKKYNLMLGMPKGDTFIKDRENCQCCSII